MYELLSVYVDGETKTGKGAAGVSIAETLTQSGLEVYYDVAGDFYRRYTALVRSELGLDENQALLAGTALELAAQKIYDEHRLPLGHDESFGDLQRPSISNSVSVLGKLAIAQRAGNEWWAMSVRNAWAKNAAVLVIDGRNPRAKINEQNFEDEIKPRNVLNLYMVCDTSEAARRTLIGNGTEDPTISQIRTEELNVIMRRKEDRTRKDNPFVPPLARVNFVPGQVSADNAIRQSWEPQGEAELPITIQLDNTRITKPQMLASVSELALAAVSLKPASRIAG